MCQPVAYQQSHGEQRCGHREHKNRNHSSLTAWSHYLMFGTGLGSTCSKLLTCTENYVAIGTWPYVGLLSSATVGPVLVLHRATPGLTNVLEQELGHLSPDDCRALRQP